MANFVRRIVSGNKARFKDAHLDIELDLVNHRDDAKRFLEHRHGKNYWVFNFCPLRENSYPASLFDGRVSRYPFPDHHAPPLAILPLAVREMRAWLSGSPERVIVLHCKAGKGRSGTLACAYLLSLDEAPSPPKLERSLTKKEWARRRVDQVVETVETENMEDESKDDTTKIVRTPPTDIMQSDGGASSCIKDSSNDQHNEDGLMTLSPTTSVTDKDLTETPTARSPASKSASDPRSALFTNETKVKSNTTLEDVIALHTSRRMKAPTAPNKKLKQGVSIPSQRRWLFYWSLILSDAAPPGFWSISDPLITSPKPRVRLRQIKIRMHELGGVKMNLLRVADKILERSNGSKNSGTARTRENERGKGLVWVSLARYDDRFVEKIEEWEKITRDKPSGINRMQGSEVASIHKGEDEELRELFSDGKWDKGKMVRSFARLGDVEGMPVRERTDNVPIIVHTLRPLSDKRWQAMQTVVERTKAVQKDRESAPPSTASSVIELGARVEDEGGSSAEGAYMSDGIILDAEREVRAKLYIGSVFMGWFWFIPTFHMPQPPPSPSAPSSTEPPSSSSSSSTHLILTRKELDFPLGAGSALIDVDVTLEWVVPRPMGTRELQPPKTQTSQDSRQGIDGEPQPGVGPMGIVAASLQAAVSDKSDREVVEVVQASDQ